MYICHHSRKAWLRAGGPVCSRPLTMSTQPPPHAWRPATDEQRAIVTEQLERMLSSSPFKQSKRYPQFLRYVVEETLWGRERNLKERTLGVQVFGRDPQYDSNSDPIVRVSAGEVRKRIAQYYHEPGHERELRIDLSPGSYVPEFLPFGASLESAQLEFVPARTRETWRRPGSSHNVVVAALAVGLLLVIIVAALHRYQSHKASALEEWWQPLLHSQSPVLVSVATSDHPSHSSPEARISSGSESVQEHILHADHVSLMNAEALERISGFLTAHEQPLRTLTSESTTFDDFRTGPAVLVGGLNNAWTMRVTGSLRFHFVTEYDPYIATIEDRQHPDSREWQIKFFYPYTQLTRDYAVIARLHAATSENMVVVVAGIASQGVGAASEFLTSESSMQEMISRLPPDWQKKNVEGVIQTDVINGQAGPPRLVAVYVW